MGCDIHMYVEGKIDCYPNKEKKWINIDNWKVSCYEGVRDKIIDIPAEDKNISFTCESIMDNRDYQLFSLLADVRSEEGCYPPIAKPRGLPQDIHYVTKKLADNLKEEAYSHSYFTLKELKESPYSKGMNLQGWVLYEDDIALIDKEEEIPHQIFFEYSNKIYEEAQFRKWRGYLNGNLMRIIKCLENKMKNNKVLIKKEDDIRIVFWFCN